MSLDNYNNLTDEDRKVLDDFMNVARPLSGDIARFMKQIENLLLSYNGSVLPILDKLTNPTDLIPNKTNLSDAQPVSRGGLEALIAGFAQIEDDYNVDSRIQFWILMAGLQNTL